MTKVERAGAEGGVPERASVTGRDALAASTGDSRAGAPGMARRFRRGVAVPTFALALAVSVLGGCVSPEASVEQMPRERVSVKADVKRALLESDVVGGAAIRVVVDEKGTVRLEGFVSNERERLEALRLAREATGGAEPVDALEVRD